MYYLKTDIHKPLRFHSAGIFTAERTWSHCKRVIDNIEVIIGIKGTVFIQQDDQKFEIGEGDILLLLPGHTHGGYAPSPNGTSFYWMHFQWNDDCCVLDDKSGLDELHLAGNNPYFNGLNNMILLPALFHADSMERIGILFHQLLHISQSHYYSNLGVDYIVTSMLVELTEQAIAKVNHTQNPPQENLSQILEWIRAHITQDISLQHVAYEFNYTREYLARYFKKHMGMSMQEYINNMKIAKARELLCQSDQSIREIATDLGYKDDKYFLRLFKRYERITPREYRKAYYRLHMNNG